MPKTLLTDIAEAKLAKAATSSSQVVITHIALGDGDDGKPYDPAHDQTALKHERARRAIDSRSGQGANIWLVKAAFPADTPAFAVREIGFIDTDGDLIAIWAGVDVAPRQTGAIVYRVEHALTFSAVKDGLIIVDAQDDLPETNLGRIRALEADGAVITRRLANDAVTTPKLADEAVTGDKLAKYAVTGPKLARQSVTQDHLAAGVAVSGPQGPKGDRGYTGPRGPAGPVGEHVQDVRLGEIVYSFWSGWSGWKYTEDASNILVGIVMRSHHGSDPYGFASRPLQKQINGSWYTVSQV